MKLVFDRMHQSLIVIPECPLDQIQVILAANNVVASSRGPWPAGVYQAEKFVELSGEAADPNGPFGRYFMRFIVPDRDGIDDAIDIGADGLPDPTDGAAVGLGIHAGRRDGKDGQGRQGFRRPTHGCIRSNDEGMAVLANLWAKEKMATLWVTD